MSRIAEAQHAAQSDSLKFQQNLTLVSQDAQSTRTELRQLLGTWYPPTVLEILQRDPSLLTNEQYMAAYPRLGEFLERHPEVRHNPGFFLGRPLEIAIAPRTRTNIAEPVIAFLSFVGVVGVLIWIVRAIIDHRRWLRVSRLQTEAHTRLMERFSSNEDLLAFIETPAGKRFLESSVMPVEPRTINAPVGRILWSVQVGLVMIAGGFGFNFVSTSIRDIEVSEAIGVLGIVLMTIGVGFIVSGLAAYILSRRFGLFERDTAS